MRGNVVARPARLRRPPLRHNGPVGTPRLVAGTNPYDSFARSQWEGLAAETPLPLTPEDVMRIASLGDPIDMSEVDAIYRPLSALLQLYVNGHRRVGAEKRYFLHDHTGQPTPYVIGIGGSVAVGKSTVARLLQLLLSRWPRTPRVDLVTTDGFLLPNAQLRERGLMRRKGFPESYRRRELVDFVARVKSGQTRVAAPVYSHVRYDIVAGATITVSHPDILIVEGLNVLQPPRLGAGASGTAVSDYFDFSIYVDAEASDIEQWYVDRFLQLKHTAFRYADSYFRTYAALTDAQARARAHEIWRTINLPNLELNIAPTRPRATMIFRKGPHHRIEAVLLRKT